MFYLMKLSKLVNNENTTQNVIYQGHLTNKKDNNLISQQLCIIAMIDFLLNVLPLCYVVGGLANMPWCASVTLAPHELKN